MVGLPTGTVTFLFTDLEVSTRLWDQEPDAMSAALARHDEILREGVVAHGGHLVKGRGDGVHAVFATADAAVRTAIACELAMDAEPWTVSEPLRARIGIHTGVAELRDGDYFGSAVNRAARLEAIAHGGQIVCSQTTAELARDVLAEGVVFVDLGEHRLRDLSRPERVFAVNASGLQSGFAPLASVDAFPTNLPLQTTSFVGREEDMAGVIDALGEARVVTLTGVGGVGKTRLAVQVAAEVLDRFEGGAWLIELGPLSDAAGLPEVVAAALGVQPRQGLSIADSVVEWLRVKELLVIFDNCEHVIGAAARMVDAIVTACPRIRVLATSREGLGLRGERQLTVPSLDVANESVQLFTQRAHEASSGFALDASTAPAVDQICARLDGIPLALELAAARTRMMTPSEISARLDERFRLLTGGSRTAVERHQTLRQAVDWSYDLLDPRERVVLDRLGVFAGGFTLEAAEATVSGDRIDSLDVFDAVGQLVDKSLVVADRDGDMTRYRLLETIRQYALERLDDAQMTDTIRRRHATWCAGFVAQASVGLQGPGEPAWLERVDGEIDNLRAALTWATGADDAELSLSLIGSFGPWNLWSRRLGYVLGPWAEVALATTGAAGQSRFVPVLALQVLDHYNHQRLDEVERDARRALQLMAEPGTPFSVNPWSILCFSFLSSGRAEEVEGADAFVEAARATGDDYTLAGALTLVAGWWYVLADLEVCRRFAEEALQIAHRIGNPTLIAMSGTFLGAALETTDPTRARTILETAVEYGRAVASGFHLTTALGYLARITGDAAGSQWAREFCGVVDLAYEAGDASSVLMYLDVYSQALANSDRAELAATLAAAVGELAPHMSNPISIAHRRDTNERLLTQLGEQRFAELTAHGATLGYEDVVALALAELDRVVAYSEG